MDFEILIFINYYVWAELSDGPLIRLWYVPRMIIWLAK